MSDDGRESRPAPAVAEVRLPPKDAATLILLERHGTALRVLMGKRTAGHVFMPNLYVFPGGRRDRGDHALPYCRDLHADVLSRLVGRSSEPAAFRRARGLALAAIRELREETSLVIGRQRHQSDVGDCPGADLGCLRYVARAITPPGQVRRFDTRFFLAFADEAGITPEQIRDSDELSDLQWLDIDRISGVNMPQITRTILDDVRQQMEFDPSLPFGSAGPFYYPRNGRFVRASI
ncbi:MAG: NUDIX hydrolase [Allorhizobium sp.]